MSFYISSYSNQSIYPFFLFHKKMPFEIMNDKKFIISCLDQSGKARLCCSNKKILKLHGFLINFYFLC